MTPGIRDRLGLKARGAVVGTPGLGTTTGTGSRHLQPTEASAKKTRSGRRSSVGLAAIGRSSRQLSAPDSNQESPVPILTERHAEALENHARALDQHARAQQRRSLAQEAVAREGGVIPAAWHSGEEDHRLRRQVSELGGLLP